MKKIDWPTVIKATEEHGRARRKNGLLPEVNDELNFLCGAMAVMSAIEGNLGMLPARWVFGPLANKSPLGDEPNE
jgi:hypothetical protein